MEIVDIKSDKQLRYMWRFFKNLPDNELFTIPLKQYLKLCKGAMIKGIVNSDGHIIGGSMIYSTSIQNNFLNHYIPEELTKSKISLDMLDNILKYIKNHAPFKTYIKTNHPEKFSKYIKKIEGMEYTYEVLFPASRFR